MQTLRMNLGLLNSFLEALKAFGTLMAPVERSPGVFTLGPIDNVEAARPDALRTVLPFKKLLLKPSFCMLERRDGQAPRESAAGTFKAGERVPVQEFLDKPIDPARLLKSVQEGLTAAWRKG